MATNDTNNIVNNQFNVPVQVHSSSTRVVSNTETSLNQVSDDKLDHLKIFENLPKVLVELGKETLQPFESRNDETIGRKTGYVPLQFAIYKQNNNKTSLGHLHIRKETIKSYEKSFSDTIKPSDFFEKSKQTILQSYNYQKIQSVAERENYLSLESKIIGVIGQAGVGKSTLIKYLFQQFVETEQLYQANYVFQINIRDFYDKSEISLFEFLLGENACDSNEWTNDKKVSTQIFELLTDSESVCILLDGLHEVAFKPDCDVNMNKSTLFKQKPRNILLTLLCGQLFPKAKKIITSRPGQMLDLPFIYKPKFILNIRGITQHGINQICQNICGNHASQVYRQIEKQPDLQSYTLVPINCVLVIHCIYKFVLNDSNKFISPPNNITNVFVSSFFQFLDTSHVLNKCNNFNLKNFDHLRKISELAWSGIKERKFYFNQTDLKKAKLDQVDISSVTVIVKRQNFENRVTFLQNATSNCTYFSHLLIQEFFSAIYCLFFMDSKTFKRTFFSSKQFDLQSNEFLMVTKFLFGLSNPETLKGLKHIYPTISNPTEHIKLLQSLAKIIALTACTIEGEHEQFKSVLTVCSWAYEFRDQVFCQQISDTLPQKILPFGIILPSDVFSFCYVIKTRTMPLSLSILSTLSTFVGKAFRQLLDGLQFIQTNSAVQLKELHLRYIKINNESGELLSKLIDYETKEIAISGCYLTAGGFKKVLTPALNLKCLITLVNITIEFLDDEMSDHVTHLIDDEMENVVLDCNNSTTYQHRKVSSRTLEIYRYDFNNLILENTNIDEASGEILSKLIDSETKEITISYCNLTAGGFETVSTQALNLKCKITLVGITIEFLDDEMSDHVTHLIDDEMENVVLDCNNSTTYQHRKVSSRTLEIYRYDFDNLILENTNIDEASGKILSKLIDSETKEITISYCNLTAGGFETVSTQALNLKCQITLFNITIIFTDDEMSDHVTHLDDDEIENVDLDCSKSTTQQNRKVSSRTLRIYRYDLKELSLFNINIDDESAEVLSNFITDRLECITINHCSLTALGFEKVSTRASSLKCPLQSLNLRWSKFGDSGFESVATCVHKINQLRICCKDDENLTLNGVKALVEGIKTSPIGLKKLELEINLIDDDHVTKLNDDDIKNIDIDNSTTKQVISSLYIYWDYEDKKLGFYSTNIDDESADVLCDLIFDKTEKIELYYCNVTPRGMKNISTRISNLTCPLQSLNLKWNKIGDSGFASVATCVHKINQLFIRCDYDEDLTLNGVKALVEGIKTSLTGLKKLELEINLIDDDHVTGLNHDDIEEAYNSTTQYKRNFLCLYIYWDYEDKKLGFYSTNIDDESANVLCDLIFDKTEKIELYYCNVTPRGMKKISTRISNLTCPLQSLNLRWSKIGDSGFASVATCVHKINQLFIRCDYDEDLTLNGVKALVESIENLPIGKMEELVLGCPYEMKSAVRHELLGLKDKVGCVELNYERIFEDQSRRLTFKNDLLTKNVQHCLVDTT